MKPTTPAMRKHVETIKSDHKQLIEDGKIPAASCVVAYTVAVGARTLDQIRAEAKAQGVDEQAYIDTFLQELAGDTLFADDAPIAL